MVSNNKLSAGYFSKNAIGESLKSEMITKDIWNNDCPVSLDRLVLLNLSYTDFDGKKHHDGQMIVFDVVADSVLQVFKTLYKKSFPINSIRLINDFDGDDNKSLQANNTSCFNCRKIMNSDKYSIHSYGMAIDINPLQNPCLDTEYKPGKIEVEVLPPRGMQYMNRTKIRSGMVESVIDDKNGLTVVDVLVQNGFSIWGGQWNFPIDLHHFQISSADSKEIANLPFDHGVQYFASMLKKSTV